MAYVWQLVICRTYDHSKWITKICLSSFPTKIHKVANCESFVPWIFCNIYNYYGICRYFKVLFIFTNLCTYVSKYTLMYLWLRTIGALTSDTRVWTDDFVSSSPLCLQWPYFYHTYICTYFYVVSFVHLIPHVLILTQLYRKYVL